MRTQFWPMLYTLAGFLICLAIIFAPLPARAQSAETRDQEARYAWIHQFARHCCDHRDCQPTQVTMTFTGWKPAGADNVVPFAQVIRWPFSGPWACVVNRYARCVLAEGGM